MHPSSDHRGNSYEAPILRDLNSMNSQQFTSLIPLGAGPQVPVPHDADTTKLALNILLWTRITSCVADEIHKLLGSVAEQQQLTHSPEPYSPSESTLVALSSLSRSLSILSDAALKEKWERPPGSTISLRPTIPQLCSEILTSSMPSKTTSHSSPPSSKEQSQDQANLPWYRQEPQNPKHVLPQEE